MNPPLQRAIGWITFSQGFQLSIPSAKDSILAKAFDIYGPAWAWAIVWFATGLTAVAASYLHVPAFRRAPMLLVIVLWLMMLVGVVVDYAFGSLLALCFVIILYSVGLLIRA